MIEINWPLLLAQLVTFLMAVAALWKVAWRPMSDHLRQRSESIKNDLELIKKKQQAVLKWEEEFADHLSHIQKEVDEIITKAKTEAQKKRDEIVDQAHKEAQAIRSKAQQNIQAEQMRIMNEITSDLFIFSVELTEKILSRSIDRSLHEQLFRDTLHEFEHRMRIKQGEIPA